MTASAELYAVASAAALEATRYQHELDPAARRCARDCDRCRVEARARLYVRAGDSARELEERAKD